MSPRFSSTSVGFPVVCLCGSTKFKDEYIAAMERFTLEGWIVLTVGLFAHADNKKLTRDQKAKLDQMHLKKIDMASRVHVINKDGYIGSSTKGEIKHAQSVGKQVTYEFPQSA